jgi:aminoglycoside phosphotransferase family enzyme
LSAKVAALRTPAPYPDHPAQVRALETHMSWVFLTPAQAYKLKKPVRYPFLDFSTLARRRQDCEQEVKLNRRLAPDVYLGIVPLTAAAHGALRVNGDGEVVEWLVQMRRLPAERMLDSLIRRRAVREQDIHDLAATLAEVYRQCPRASLTGAEYRGEFATGIDLSRAELSEPVHELPQPLIARLCDAQAEFLHRHAAWFNRRVADGRIVEGHGDLRPEHVCLESRPVVIDCLEFNRHFRIVDPVDELAFLAMECELLGAPRVGEWLLADYSRITRDAPAPPLIAFYKLYRACLRARISIRHVHELEQSDWPTWRRRAAEYLRLAESYLGPLASTG